MTINRTSTERKQCCRWKDCTGQKCHYAKHNASCAQRSRKFITT